MSDSPPKNKKPSSGNHDEDLPALSEEDLFLKTNAGVSPTEESQESPAPEEALQEFQMETVEAFDSLDTLPQEPSLQMEQHSEEFQPNEQKIPAFDTSGLDEIASDAPETPQFVSDFSEPEQAPEPPTPAVEAAPMESPVSNTPTIDSIKNYSESLNAEAPATAQLPFTLRIEGKLNVQEAEKLLDVLSREKMDIREVDIEPQLEAGRLLIPRISEYAGVMLIQALRGVRAKIFFQPSDIETGDVTGASPGDFNQNLGQEEAPPTADSLPVTQGDDLPQLGVFQVIDTLIASGMLSTKSVEAANSNEFTTLTEALMRELKFKAVRRGARGITHLSIQLTPLTLPTDYRVTVSGTAVS